MNNKSNNKNKTTAASSNNFNFIQTGPRMPSFKQNKDKKNTAKYKKNFFIYLKQRFKNVSITNFQKKFFELSNFAKKIIKNKYENSKKKKNSFINNKRFTKKKYDFQNKNFFINFIKRRIIIENFNKVFVNWRANEFIDMRKKNNKYKKFAQLWRTKNDGKTKRRVFIPHVPTNLPNWLRLPIQINDPRSYRTGRSAVYIDKKKKFTVNRGRFYWKLFNSSLTKKKKIKIYVNKNKKKNKKFIKIKKNKSKIKQIRITKKRAIHSKKWKSIFWINLTKIINKQKKRRKKKYRSWIQLDQAHIKVSKDAKVNNKTGGISYAKRIRKISHKLPLVKNKIKKKKNKKNFKKFVYRWAFKKSI